MKTKIKIRSIRFRIWLYFLGGSMASQARNHIDCGVLVLYIKKEKSLALFRLARMVPHMAPPLTAPSTLETEML